MRPFFDPADRNRSESDFADQLPNRTFPWSFAVSAKQGVAILQIDQIPDSRRTILEGLKQHGAATISRLASELHLTGEAIRQQLLQLRRDGWIEPSETEKSRIGRPAATYRLTVEGEHLFPKRYDGLLLSFIDAIVGELGPEAALRIFRRISDERVRKFESSTRGLPIEQRLEALKSFYSDGDAYMTVEPQPDGFALIERNCPFYNTAMGRPALCSITVHALTRLLGVRVEREESFQKGDNRCAFHVHADQPVNGDRLPFKLEAQTTI
jgi:predicted ArsR family transcriptional regulator